MGRYYTGDIEGKFWFAVQSSDDADFFGVEGYQPNFLNYCFEESDLPKINEGVENCLKELGKFKEKLDEFFEKCDSYTDEDLAKNIGVSKDKIHNLLGWYARLELGLKIQKCVKENGGCEFEAEC